METAVSASSQDKQADASTERDSCLADDAQDGLGALSTASQVKANTPSNRSTVFYSHWGKAFSLVQAIRRWINQAFQLE